MGAAACALPCCADGRTWPAILAGATPDCKRHVATLCTPTFSARPAPHCTCPDFNLSKILDTDTGSGRSTIANMNPRWLVGREVVGGGSVREACNWAG